MKAALERRVVADASPLIGLAAAGVFDVLRQLFGTVTITRPVLEEIRAGAGLPGASELEAALAAGWIRVAAAPAGTWHYPELGTGEASTIALGLERSSSAAPPLLLIDDVRAQEAAAALGLEVADVPGLLVAAKQAGLVERVQPLFARLARRGFVIQEAALRRALAAAAEGLGRD